MANITRYKQLYNCYFNNDEYVFGNYQHDYIIIYKRLPNSITSEENDITQKKKFKQYIASHLEIVLIFNKFKPEKRSIHFSDDKIQYDVKFYLNVLPAFYFDLDKCRHYTGKYIEWYSDGTMKLTGYIKHGTKEKTWIYYNENGKIQCIGKMINNLRCGAWIIYTSGDIEKQTCVTECNYKGGILFGDVTVWKNKEKKIKLKQFAMKNGKKNGLYTEYFDDSNNIKTKGNFIDDKKSGQWFEAISDDYYTKTNYCNGVVKGYITKYHVDGTICDKMYIA